MGSTNTHYQCMYNFNQIPWFDLTTFNMKVLITLALLFACALANPRYPREDTEITKNQEKEIGGEYDDYEPHQQDLKSNVHQIKKKKKLYLGSRISEDGNSTEWCDCNTYATRRDPCCPPCPPDDGDWSGGGWGEVVRTARSC